MHHNSHSYPQFVPQPSLTFLVEIFKFSYPLQLYSPIRTPVLVKPSSPVLFTYTTLLNFPRMGHSCIDFSFKVMATHLKPASAFQAIGRSLLQEEHCTLSHCLHVSSTFLPLPLSWRLSRLHKDKGSTPKSTNLLISIPILMTFPPVILDEKSLYLSQSTLLQGLQILSFLIFSQISPS